MFSRFHPLLKCRSTDFLQLCAFLLLVSGLCWGLQQGAENLGYNWHWSRVPRYLVTSVADGWQAGPLLKGLLLTLQITAVSLLQVESPEQRWPMILDYYSQFAGEPLEIMDSVYKSVSQSNYHNRAVVNLLQAEGWLGADSASTLDVYNKQSCVAVTARQLAAMGALGGVFFAASLALFRRSISTIR